MKNGFILKAHVGRLVVGITVSAEAAVRLLVIEDVDADWRLIQEDLVDAAAEVDAVRATGLSDAKQHGDVDLILTDLGLPDAQGLETLDAVLAHFPDVPVIVLSGLNDPEMGLEAVRRGAVDYLVKGRYEAAQLAAAVRHGVERGQLPANEATSEPKAHMVTGGPEAILAMLDADPNRPALIVAADRNPAEMKRVLDLDNRPGPVRFIDATGSGGHSTGEILVVSPVRLEAIAMRMERIAAGLGPDTLCIICSLDGLAMFSGHDVVLEFSHYITHRFRALGRDLAVRARPGSRFIDATKGLLEVCP